MRSAFKVRMPQHSLPQGSPVSGAAVPCSTINVRNGRKAAWMIGAASSSPGAPSADAAPTGLGIQVGPPWCGLCCTNPLLRRPAALRPAPPLLLAPAFCPAPTWCNERNGSDQRQDGSGRAGWHSFQAPCCAPPGGRRGVSPIGCAPMSIALGSITLTALPV